MKITKEALLAAIAADPDNDALSLAILQLYR